MKEKPNNEDKKIKKITGEKENKVILPKRNPNKVRADERYTVTEEELLSSCDTKRKLVAIFSTFQMFWLNKKAKKKTREHWERERNWGK